MSSSSSTTLETISAALKLVETKKQNLKTAYHHLLSLSHPLPLSSWPHIDAHFSSLHTLLSQRFLLLQSQHNKTPPSLLSPPSTINQHEPTFVNPRPQLVSLCENMDAKGLRDFLILHVKEKNAIQAEIPGALRCALDPALLVLDSLEGYYGETDPSDMDQRRLRRVCIVLLEQLRGLCVNIGSGVREKARVVMGEWKGCLRSGGVKTLEALGFLHFVLTYGLVCEVGVDEVVDFFALAANSDEVPQLCRIMGFTEKVPDLVQKLVDKGKHILAVKYVFEFGLADKIPPVPILKACVDEANKLGKSLLQEGKSLNEAKAREINALKTVIKVIENHKLESQYPPAIIEQQIVQLNEMKAGKKRIPPHSLNIHPQSRPQQQQMNKKQKQQQIGSNHPHPETSAQVGLTAAQKIVGVANTALQQYQEPLVQTIGPYGFAGVPMGSSGNPTPGGSHLYSEPNLQTGNHDRITTYSGYGLQQYYQSRYPQ